MSLSNLVKKAKAEVAKRECETPECETPAYAVYVDAAEGDDENCFTCSIHDFTLCPWPESRYGFDEEFLRGCRCENYRPAII